MVGWPLAIGRAGLKGNQLARNMCHGSEAYKNDHALRGNSAPPSYGTGYNAPCETTATA